MYETYPPMRCNIDLSPCPVSCQTPHTVYRPLCEATFPPTSQINVDDLPFLPGRNVDQNPYRVFLDEGLLGRRVRSHCLQHPTWKLGRVPSALLADGSCLAMMISRIIVVWYRRWIKNVVVALAAA